MSFPSCRAGLQLAVTFRLMICIAGLAVPSAAAALSCAAMPPASKLVEPYRYTEAALVGIGKVREIHARGDTYWHRWALATVELSEQFKGKPARAVTLFLNDEFKPGDLVVLHANPETGTRPGPNIKPDTPPPAPPVGANGKPIKAEYAADGPCKSGVMFLQSEQGRRAEAYLRSLPPPGSGGRLMLRILVSPVKHAGLGLTQSRPLHAPGLAAQPVELHGKEWTYARTMADWLAAGEQGVIIDRVPEGSYRFVVPEVPGYRVQCVRQHWYPLDCKELRAVDRADIGYDLVYVPESSVAIDVRDASGKPVDVVADFRLERKSAGGVEHPLGPIGEVVVRTGWREQGEPAELVELPDGRYSATLLITDVEKYEHHGKEAYRVRSVREWPLPGGQDFTIRKGRNVIAVTLPAELQPITVTAALGRQDAGSVLPGTFRGLTGQKAEVMPIAEARRQVDGTTLRLPALPGQSWVFGVLQQQGHYKQTLVTPARSVRVELAAP